MSGFSYPAPFEFENAKKKAPSASTTNKVTGVARSSTPNRRAPPVRSKSNDESLFSAGAVPMQRRGPGLGPKTKSGRHLPKPAPSLPIHGATGNNLRGRAAPKSRGVGQTQSSNLELAQAARSRSSSLPKKPQRRKPSEVEDFIEAESSPRRPSSLKAFLTSPVRKSKKVDDISVQSDQQKPSSLKQFLISPMRRASNPRSMDANLSVGKLDLDEDCTKNPETDFDARSKFGGRRNRSRSSKDDGSKSSKKEKSKPKSFQQLLGKKNHPSRNKSEDDEKWKLYRDNHASPDQREPSLSPEQEPQKPGSMLTNLLDTLYDSYLDPKAGEDEEEDGFNALQNSVSRLDMSLSSLF